MKDSRYIEKVDWFDDLSFKQKVIVNDGMKGVCIYHDGSDCNYFGYGVYCLGKCKSFELKKETN